MAWPIEYQTWIKEVEEKGHKLKRSSDFDGDIDMFIVDNGFHNGPMCEKCSQSWCINCTSSDQIQKCKE